MPKDKKLLEDEIFFPYRMNRWETLRSPGTKTMVSFEDGRLIEIEYSGEILPVYDHYDTEINKKLGKKLFKP